ncbi:MAG: CDP-alcohol phosphatidyltransferase family protein [Arachnia sp.]
MHESQLTLRQAHAQLSQAQKGHARGAPAYSVYVNRRVGRVLAALAYCLRLSPNAVTGVSAAHTFLGIVLLMLAPATWWTGVAVALLLALGYAWDSADGQVARLTGQGSPAGEWLDHFVDAIKIASLHLAVLVGAWFHTPMRETWWLVVPLVFSVVATVTFFGMLLNDLIKAGHGGMSTHTRGGGTLARSLLLLPTDFGVVCLVFLAWGWPSVFFWLYGALAAASMGFLLLAAVKWFREMRTLGMDAGV